MATDPVRRPKTLGRGRGRPPKNARRSDDPVAVDEFTPDPPDVEFFRDGGDDLGADLRRMGVEIASGVYARRRALF